MDITSARDLPTPPLMELTTKMTLLNQQLRMRQMANEHHQRVTNQVRSQVWQPYEPMDHV